MTQIQPTPLDEMPRAEARLLVLADTLQLLDEEKVTLTPGTYVSFRQWPVMKEEGEVNPVPSYELQSLLPDRPSARSSSPRCGGTTPSKSTGGSAGSRWSSCSGACPGSSPCANLP